MYRTIDDFISDYRMESENTLKIFKQIDPSKRQLKINENIRSMERLAWHLIQTLSEMMYRAGLQDKDELEGKPVPAILARIIDEYWVLKENLLTDLKSKWKDSELPDKIEMFGEKWPKGRILSSLITHEIHHRAQLTVIMRYFGGKVPGLYGPSKEEWAAFRMQAQE